MFAKYLLIGFIAIAFIALVIFAWQNQQLVPINYFSIQMNVSLALLVIKPYLVGVASTYFFFRLRSKEKIAQTKQLEWKHQDAKLQAEIYSDEKKLLEAKIATLEVALEKALKKRG